MSSDKKRAPRAIDLSKLGDDEAKPKASKPKNSPAADKPRKPRAATEKAVLIPVPEEAAQRRTEVSITQEQLADDLTPPPPAAGRKKFRWSRLFWAALLGLIPVVS